MTALLERVDANATSARRDATPATLDVIAQLLSELVLGQHLVLAELRRMSAGGQVSTALRPADAKALTRLLPVIAAAVGDRYFTTHELFAHAGLEVDPDIPLTTALAAVGGARKVGRLLARGAGFESGGVRLQVLGATREGLLFNLAATSRETRSAA